MLVEKGGARRHDAVQQLCKKAGTAAWVVCTQQTQWASYHGKPCLHDEAQEYMGVQALKFCALDTNLCSCVSQAHHSLEVHLIKEHFLHTIEPKGA